MTAPSFAAIAASYREMWDAMRVTRNVPALEAARRTIANKGRYEQVADATGVPWFFIAVVHNLESGGDFEKHLHNGDSLARRTWRVPAGRPATHSGPFTFEESAADALRLKNLHRITDWSIERIGYEFERYNGFGYRLHHPDTPSPYLWAGSSHYERGKYVRDGVWDANAVSQQIGAFVLLRSLMQLDPSIDPDAQPSAPLAPPSLPSTSRAPAGRVAEKLGKSRTVFGALLVGIGETIRAALDGIRELVDLLPDAAERAQSMHGAIGSLLKTAAINAPAIGGYLVLLGVLLVLYARYDAAVNSKEG